MRITLRLIISLVIVVTLVVSLSTFFQVRQEEARLSDELERRAGVLAESLQETVEPLLQQGSSKNLQRIVEKFGNRERLSGVAVYDSQGNPLAITQSLVSQLHTPPDIVMKVLNTETASGDLESIGNKTLHLYALPYVEARLLLVGGSADDDPEGAQVLSEVREKAREDPDILVLSLPPTSHVEINAIQRASSVILQKSLREGFGLTVSEALLRDYL